MTTRSKALAVLFVIVGAFGVAALASSPARSGVYETTWMPYTTDVIYAGTSPIATVVKQSPVAYQPKDGGSSGGKAGQSGKTTTKATTSGYGKPTVRPSVTVQTTPGTITKVSYTTTHIVVTYTGTASLITTKATATESYALTYTYALVLASTNTITLTDYVKSGQVSTYTGLFEKTIYYTGTEGSVTAYNVKQVVVTENNNNVVSILFKIPDRVVDAINERSNQVPADRAKMNKIIILGGVALIAIAGVTIPTILPAIPVFLQKLFERPDVLVELVAPVDQSYPWPADVQFPFQIPLIPLPVNDPGRVLPPPPSYVDFTPSTDEYGLLRPVVDVVQNVVTYNYYSAITDYEFTPSPPNPVPIYEFQNYRSAIENYPYDPLIYPPDLSFLTKAKLLKLQTLDDGKVVAVDTASLYILLALFGLMFLFRKKR